MSSKFRVDRDSLGDVKVPIDAYYGAFTSRAMKQYQILHVPPHIYLIKSFIMVKKACAMANKQLNVIDENIADAIIKSCDDILDGKLIDNFVVETINSGANTAFNMNCNEVIANRALEYLGKSKGSYDIINPNDHVNMSQSSNDTSPTSMHLAIIMNCNEMLKSLDILINSLEKKSDEFKDVIKIGRTHLMDAIPVTLGAVFEAYLFSLTKSMDVI